MTADLDRFAAEIGPDDPVRVVGGRTHWSRGGPPEDAREVAAPAGIRRLDPAEMVVEVGAGTRLDALDAALAEHGQMVVVDGPPDATVGGALVAGLDGVRRRGRGPMRDSLLQARYVDDQGRLVTAGGPTVKNVSGYDLCRLLVGSIGTLGCLGEVILRTRPRPAAEQWLAGEADPDAALAVTHRPAAVLWDGATTWVALEGHPGDVDAQVAALDRLGIRPVGRPPELPPHRWSMPPAIARQRAVPGESVVEIGVGVVHATTPPPSRPVDATVATLCRRVKARFDPRGRLNPGRDVLVGP